MNILIIDGWERLYKCAEDAGLNVYVLKVGVQDDKNDSVRSNMSYCDDNEDDIAAAAKTIIEKNKISSVFSFQEKFLLIAAKINERHQLNGNSIIPVELTINKVLMREKLASTSLGNVRFLHVSKIEDISEADGFTFPAILKPLDGTGSSGVSIVNNFPELYLQSQELNWKDNTGYILEEYKPGNEYSVEAISHNGRHLIVAITEKSTTGAPHFVETGHKIPAGLTIELENLIKDSCEFFLNIIGHQTGPTHTEVIVNEIKNELSIVESHTRCGGDYIFDLVEHSTGINMFYETFLMQMPLYTLPELNIDGKHAAVRYIKLPRGKIKSISGIDKAREINNILRVEFFKAIGNVTANFSCSNDRNGFVMAVADSSENLENSINKALRIINVDIS